MPILGGFQGCQSVLCASQRATMLQVNVLSKGERCYFGDDTRIESLLRSGKIASDLPMLDELRKYNFNSFTDSCPISRVINMSRFIIFVRNM